MLINVPDTWTFAGIKGLEIVFMLKNKSHDKIDNDRTAKCEKGQINKIHPDSSCADP